VVADDGGCQTFSTLTEHSCLSRRIREGSGLWYRFQLLSLEYEYYLNQQGELEAILFK